MFTPAILFFNPLDTHDTAVGELILSNPDYDASLADHLGRQLKLTILDVAYPDGFARGREVGSEG